MNVEQQTNQNSQAIAVMSNDLGYIRKAIDSLNNKFDNLAKSMVSRDQHENHENRISDIEDNIKWIARLVFGTVVVAVLSLVVVVVGK